MTAVPAASLAAPPNAYAGLKHAILDGDLAPGQALVESTLAKMFQVSRTPVREALQRLEQDGLVIRSPSGLVVRQRTPEEIIDLYDTRIVLEALASRFAADRRTEHDIRQLRQMIAFCEQITPGANSDMVAANREFHRLLWRASRNQSLTDILERLYLHLARYPETTLSSDGRWSACLQDHADLVQAIEDRDGDRAHLVASRHMIGARDIRLKLFADEGPALSL